MEDAVSPSEETSKALFEMGFLAWSHLRAPVSEKPSLPAHCLEQVESAFPDHPAFPQQLLLEYSGGNLFASGVSTWDTKTEASSSCLLPSFQLPFRIPVSVSKPTTVCVSRDRQPYVPNPCKKDDNHIMILVLAWAYVMSARWAELIPGTKPLEYTSSRAKGFDFTDLPSSQQHVPISVDLGTVDEDAARWWASVLAPQEGWLATIHTPRQELRSPWSVRLPKPPIFVLSGHLRPSEVPSTSSFSPAASFAVAMRYLLEYTTLHGIEDQSRMALATALLLPLANFEGRRVSLRAPRILHRKGLRDVVRPGNEDRRAIPTPQLDKFLTLSCNLSGISALLSSIFFDPSAFAVLDSVRPDSQALTHILVRRNPRLSFLWLGAVITGAHTNLLRRARLGISDIELHSAVWTQTLQSFIQLPLSRNPRAGMIQRSDECRLLYLASEDQDTEIEVRLHVNCGGHGLTYKLWTWCCTNGNQDVHPSSNSAPVQTLDPLYCPDPRNSEIISIDADRNRDIVVPFDDFDPEDDDASAQATLRVLMWLRRGGFPATEQGMRRHEWLCEVLDQEDEEAYESWSDSNDSDRGTKRKAKSAISPPKLAR
ncbi:hypothetical protein BGZ61DRAFT_491664 [Ilyonectria robusta]|uniref:uncharacterized protein n=1 Tax=Ilyonectria robusta TaxID=1079257 RepID=UPI001E8EBA8B|nr:uncharacterized protein BGZ61DRAFT_491664 [Ilyonectria robusta]KAH8729259.1 hypothetical protein BGZ61DRAFT_491664 [Ilyonectria robusta]